MIGLHWLAFFGQRIMGPQPLQQRASIYSKPLLPRVEVGSPLQGGSPLRGSSPQLRISPTHRRLFLVSTKPKAYSIPATAFIVPLEEEL